jgi:hypothetical protein
LAHSTNSFWNYFRRKIEDAKNQGYEQDELFLFLPLEIYLPIKPLKVNKKFYDAEFRIYLFPFGSIVTNLKINLKKQMSLDDFVNFSNKLNSASIRFVFKKKGEDLGPFKRFSRHMCTQISTSLFGNLGVVRELYSHKMLYFKETKPILQKTAESDHRAIKAAMTGRSYQDIICETIETVNEYLGITEEKDKNERKKGLILDDKKDLGFLFFNKKTSLFYKSPVWTEYVNGPKCMQTNYVSFLIVLFALNSFLTIFSRIDKNSFSLDKFFYLKKALDSIFKKEPYYIYYENFTPGIVRFLPLV